MDCQGGNLDIFLRLAYNEKRKGLARKVTGWLPAALKGWIELVSFCGIVEVEFVELDDFVFKGSKIYFRICLVVLE